MTADATHDGAGTSIVFEDVSKTYPDGTLAIENLNLSIPNGSLTAFVGPSGCGKTTSMRMINRMITPTSGRILVGGQDIATIEPTKLRRSMGYVLQNAGLFPHRTAVENVATTLLLAGKSKSEARRKAEETLRLVRLRPHLDNKYPAQLSGGQQQRVGVARALACQPPVLLMDEPFSAVDPVVRSELQQELLRLRSELSQTVVFVTHDIDEALLLGDHIAVFGPGGRLHQFASGQELLTNPADDFVADMIGRDRGFRALGFLPAGISAQAIEPDAHGEVTVPNSSWTLVLDGEGRPSEWRSPTRSVVTGGGCGPDGDLRSALDSILSSPAGPGIALDASGAYRGLIDRGSVLARVADAGLAE